MHVRLQLTSRLLTIAAGAAAFSFSLVGVAHAAPATGQSAFEAPAATAAVERYAKLLEDMYVDPAMGEKYAEMLRAGLAAGRYSSFPSAEEFADAVPRDLMKINPDLHLSILPASVPTMGVISKTAYAGGTCPRAGGQLVHSMGKSGWLAPEVAYVEFCGFQGGDANLRQLRNFLEEHRNARALIIDNRGNVGGAQEEMDTMFPYFFRSMIEILRFQMRREVADEDSNPLKTDPRMKQLTDKVGAQFAYFVLPDPQLKTKLLDAEIVVLTSRATASAGEAATFALKRTGRAEVVGEVTQGAGHLGPTISLGGGYRAFIPIARIFDPETGVGWERRGVQPDLKVEANAALERALARLGVDASAGKHAWSSLKSAQSPQ